MTVTYSYLDAAGARVMRTLDNVHVDMVHNLVNLAAHDDAMAYQIHYLSA